MSVKTALTALADVIRTKTGTAEKMTIAHMTRTLDECKTWGVEQVSGIINNDTTSETLTISNLPFSEVYAVYVHDLSHTKASNYYVNTFFGNIKKGDYVTHIRHSGEVICYNAATVTYENGTLTIAPGRLHPSNFISGTTSSFAQTIPVFSTDEFSYYIIGAKA